MQQQQQQYVFFFFSHKEIQILALEGNNLLERWCSNNKNYVRWCDAKTANCTAIREWQGRVIDDGAVCP